MTRRDARHLALGGLLSLAAAMGIGRFVYTPILPVMIDALGWSKVDAGLVASANFLGYLIGAIVAGGARFTGEPRRWLMTGLALSALTTAAMQFPPALGVPALPAIALLRFIGGIASAFVIICASTVVLGRLSAVDTGTSSVFILPASARALPYRPPWSPCSLASAPDGRSCGSRRGWSRPHSQQWRRH